MTDQPSQASGSRLRPLVLNLAVTTITLGLLFTVIEVTLRLSGFSFVLYPKDIEFGRPDPIMMKSGFQEDAELFWVTKDYQQKLERLQSEKPPLLLIGDSCTHLGNYDEALVAIAEQRFNEKLQYGNLAVAGWSSFQGRQQIERDVPGLNPKVATLYFGWNDHWIGFGIEDKTVARVKKVFGSRWSGSRFVQLMMKGAVAWGARKTAYPNRVSVSDFQANLEDMIRDLREAGTIPVVLTAAANHQIGQEPAELAERWLREIDDLVPMHRQYVDTARRVAAETDTALCDLAASFETLSQAQRDLYFRGDGIHFTDAGDLKLASFLADCFDQHGLWPELLPHEE